MKIVNYAQSKIHAMKDNALIYIFLIKLLKNAEINVHLTAPVFQVCHAVLKRVQEAATNVLRGMVQKFLLKIRHA